ncbi:hypothetical protein Ancab_014868 [Ancistrocladus abbreviatus]
MEGESEKKAVEEERPFALGSCFYFCLVAWHRKTIEAWKIGLRTERDRDRDREDASRPRNIHGRPRIRGTTQEVTTAFGTSAFSRSSTKRMRRAESSCGRLRGFRRTGFLASKEYECGLQVFLDPSFIVSMEIEAK